MAVLRDTRLGPYALLFAIAYCTTTGAQVPARKNKPHDWLTVSTPTPPLAPEHASECRKFAAEYEQDVIQKLYADLRACWSDNADEGYTTNSGECCLGQSSEAAIKAGGCLQKPSCRGIAEQLWCAIKHMKEAVSSCNERVRIRALIESRQLATEDEKELQELQKFINDRLDTALRPGNDGPLSGYHVADKVAPKSLGATQQIAQNAMDEYLKAMAEAAKAAPQPPARPPAPAPTSSARDPLDLTSTTWNCVSNTAGACNNRFVFDARSFTTSDGGRGTWQQLGNRIRIAFAVGSSYKIEEGVISGTRLTFPDLQPSDSNLFSSLPLDLFGVRLTREGSNTVIYTRIR